MSDQGETADSVISVLFVCLGNICRSPLAEGVLRSLSGEAGLDGRIRVDSAGTGAWHVGEPPDPRSREVARRNGITLEGSARQVVPDDGESFDWILAMDRSNLRRLEEMGAGAAGARLHLLREFDPRADDDREVPDPYYGGEGGFDRVYEMIDRSCRALLERIRDEHGL